MLLINEEVRSGLWGEKRATCDKPDNFDEILKTLKSELKVL